MQALLHALLLEIDSQLYFLNGNILRRNQQKYPYKVFVSREKSFGRKEKTLPGRENSVCKLVQFEKRVV